MNLYTGQVLDDGSVYNFTEQDYIDVVTHEVVHVLGSGDAYEELERNMLGADTNTYPEFGIARVSRSSEGSTGVGDIDIQLMLEAQFTGNFQSYQTYTYNDINYVTSPAFK